HLLDPVHGGLVEVPLDGGERLLILDTAPLFQHLDVLLGTKVEGEHHHFPHRLRGLRLLRVVFEDGRVYRVVPPLGGFLRDLLERFDDPLAHTLCEHRLLLLRVHHGQQNVAVHRTFRVLAHHGEQGLRGSDACVTAGDESTQSRLRPPWWLDVRLYRELGERLKLCYELLYRIVGIHPLAGEAVDGGGRQLCRLLDGGERQVHGMHFAEGEVLPLLPPGEDLAERGHVEGRNETAHPVQLDDGVGYLPHRGELVHSLRRWLTETQAL